MAVPYHNGSITMAVPFAFSRRSTTGEVKDRSRAGRGLERLGSTALGERQFASRILVFGFCLPGGLTDPARGKKWSAYE